MMAMVFAGEIEFLTCIHAVFGGNTQFSLNVFNGFMRLRRNYAAARSRKIVSGQARAEQKTPSRGREKFGCAAARGAGVALPARAERANILAAGSTRQIAASAARTTSL
jgi:hypothetical protein